jgi:catechol 2,3-dioxygenase-like lactoylglutathione lyase family enzyme
MGKVSGIGGIFIYADDPEHLSGWYADALGMETHHNPADDHRYLEFHHLRFDDPNRAESTVFAIVPKEAGPTLPSPRVMVNFRVENLEAMLSNLAQREVGIEKTDERSYGRFAWLHDPEGNPIELFETYRD